MRWDMYKVIIERPRAGAGWCRDGGRRRRWRHDPESAETHEPMSRGRGSKHLTENLAPLRRFLRRQVGRRWDDVFSEICRTLRPTCAVQFHVLEHLDDMVELHAEEVDGRVFGCPSWGGYRELWRSQSAPFYVSDESGILRLLPERPRPEAPAPRDRAWVGGDYYRRIAGIWYAIELAPVAGADGAARDAVLGKRLRELGEDIWSRRAALREAHGRSDRYAVSKRQIGKRELRRLPSEVR
ncbi:MAG: hypothetical protein H6710_23420 [Myxococcales bacterium]|nr:hypothetical protein [Myxococcales bacterium]